MILNCAVVLLLCVLASLVVIEVIKRVTGMSDLNSESLRQYIIRRDI